MTTKTKLHSDALEALVKSGLVTPEEAEARQKAEEAMDEAIARGETPIDKTIAEIHANRTAAFLHGDDSGRVTVIDEPEKLSSLLNRGELEAILWQQCEAEAEYRCLLQMDAQGDSLARSHERLEAIKAKAMLETKVEHWQIYRHETVYLHTGDSITAWYPPDFTYVYIETREWGFQGGWPIDYYGIRVELLRSVFELPRAGSAEETRMIQETEAKLADARSTFRGWAQDPELNDEICRLDRLIQLLKREPMGRGHYGL